MLSACLAALLDIDVALCMCMCMCVRACLCVCVSSLILAAVMHDYRHPGVNNGYLVKKMAPLSVTYNDQSVLENFHASEAFKVMLEDKYNILKDWGNDYLRVSDNAMTECTEY